jgi:hypothetical protein
MCVEIQDVEVTNLVADFCRIGSLNSVGVVAGSRKQRLALPWSPSCRMNLKMETLSSFRKVLFKMKDKTMDNDQNCDSCLY